MSIRPVQNFGDTITLISGGVVTADTPVKIGAQLFVVPQSTTTGAGESFAAIYRGVLALPKSAIAAVNFAVGDKVYWNQGTGLCTATSTDSYIGICTATAGNTAATVDTNLNGGIIDGVAATVLKADYSAQSILVAVADDTPLAVQFAASRWLGRLAAGDTKACTNAELLTEIGVEAGADVTDAANVDTAAADLIAARHLAVESVVGVKGVGLPFLVRYDVSAAAGSIDIDAAFGFKVRIDKVEMYCSAANGGGTARLYKGTVAVPGNAITAATAMAVEGVTTSAVLVNAERALAANGTLHVVKNAAGDDGEIVLHVQRVA